MHISSNAHFIERTFHRMHISSNHISSKAHFIELYWSTSWLLKKLTTTIHKTINDTQIFWIIGYKIWHVITWHDVILYYIVTFYIMSCYHISYCVILYHDKSFYVMLSWHVICAVIWCQVMSYYRVSQKKWHQSDKITLSVASFFVELLSLQSVSEMPERLLK